MIIFIILAAVVLLYLLAIMPRMGHGKNREPFMDVYYAHRGLHDNEGEAPENSLAAFRKAVEAGYGIESLTFAGWWMRFCGSTRGRTVLNHLTLWCFCGTEDTITT